MRIHLAFTLDVDTAAWGAEYGITGDDKIREDVETYYLTMLQCSVPTDNKIVTNVLPAD